MRKFIEVEFYGDKGAWSAQVGYFRSLESLKDAWAKFLATNSYFGQVRDDQGRVLRGVGRTGYRILTPPPHRAVV